MTSTYTGHIFASIDNFGSRNGVWAQELIYRPTAHPTAEQVTS